MSSATPEAVWIGQLADPGQQIDPVDRRQARIGRRVSADPTAALAAPELTGLGAT